MLRINTRHNCVKRSQFTLIELLIVIGLLGALTALILPSLMANREEALGDVCDYNQAGTVRVLKQFKQVFNHYPVGMHTGLQSNADDASAMAGLPSAQLTHMGASTAVCPSIVMLDADQANSLIAAGIEYVCYNVGYESEDIADTVNVVQARTTTGAAPGPWLDDSDPAQQMQFDGFTIEQWEAGAVTPSWDRAGGQGIVVVLWIAPTIDWEYHPEMNKNNDWTKGEIKMGIDLQGKCPIPAEDTDEAGDPSFAYYMAYFKVYNNGTEARLIGTTCPECGILNP